MDAWTRESLEGPGPRLQPIGMIDDATSRRWLFSLRRSAMAAHERLLVALQSRADYNREHWDGVGMLQTDPVVTYE
jgi:hypothetical protein